MTTEMVKIQAEKKQAGFKRKVKQVLAQSNKSRDGHDVAQATERRKAERHHREVVKEVSRRM